MEQTKGKFIVIEGTDGAGKATQITPLTRYLDKIGKAYQVIDFPRYKDNIYGVMIGQYLKGAFGNMRDLPIKYVALPYALDRILAKPIIEKWLSRGDLVIANRYVTSNFAYSGARVSGSVRSEIIAWIEEAEYGTNMIQREDLVLLLNVTADVSFINTYTKAIREYLGREGRDIHEDDFNYQKEVAKVYLELSKKYPHWRVINCIEEGKLRSAESISQDLIKILYKEGILE